MAYAWWKTDKVTIANFEVFRWNYSSSINPFFLKSVMNDIILNKNKRESHLPLIKIWASKGSSTWSILIGIFHSNVGKNWHVFFSSYLHSGVEVCFWSIFNEFSQVFFCLAHLVVTKSAPTCVAYEYVYDFLDTAAQWAKSVPKTAGFFYRSSAYWCVLALHKINTNQLILILDIRN